MQIGQRLVAFAVPNHGGWAQPPALAAVQVLVQVIGHLGGDRGTAEHPQLLGLREVVGIGELAPLYLALDLPEQAGGVAHVGGGVRQVGQGLTTANPLEREGDVDRLPADRYAAWELFFIAHLVTSAMLTQRSFTPSTLTMCTPNCQIPRWIRLLMVSRSVSSIVLR